MFAHFTNDIQTFTGNGVNTYYSNVTWSERLHSLRLYASKSIKSFTSKKPVMPVGTEGNFFESQDAELARQTFNDNIFATWQLIYSRIRRPCVFGLFSPRSSSFQSYRSIKAYVTDNPTSNIAVTFELASEIRECERDPQHVITLSESSRTLWRNNQNLQTIINNTVRNFSERMSMQIANNATASTNTNLRL
jgi:hypothetical protein